MRLHLPTLRRVAELRRLQARQVLPSQPTSGLLLHLRAVSCDLSIDFLTLIAAICSECCKEPCWAFTAASWAHSSHVLRRISVKISVVLPNQVLFEGGPARGVGGGAQAGVPSTGGGGPAGAARLRAPRCARPVARRQVRHSTARALAFRFVHATVLCLRYRQGADVSQKESPAAPSQGTNRGFPLLPLHGARVSRLRQPPLPWRSTCRRGGLRARRAALTSHMTLLCAESRMQPQRAGWRSQRRRLRGTCPAAPSPRWRRCSTTGTPLTTTARHSSRRWPC